MFIDTMIKGCGCGCGWRFKVNCPLLGPGTIGGMLSLGELSNEWMIQGKVCTLKMKDWK